MFHLVYVGLTFIWIVDLLILVDDPALFALQCFHVQYVLVHIEHMLNIFLNVQQFLSDDIWLFVLANQFSQLSSNHSCVPLLQNKAHHHYLVIHHFQLEERRLFPIEVVECIHFLNLLIDHPYIVLDFIFLVFSQNVLIRRIYILLIFQYFFYFLFVFQRIFFQCHCFKLVVDRFQTVIIF